jgi:Flp pilus assembly protein TadB
MTESHIITDELEVDIQNESIKAIIKGKTGVPFKTLVKLILQRKVTVLFEKWGKDAIVINSELLTDLASAPQDNADNREHMIYVTLGVGMFVGILAFVALQLVLMLAGVRLYIENLVYILLTMVGVVIIGWLTIQARRKQKSTKLYDTLESIANVVPKK